MKEKEKIVKLMKSKYFRKLKKKDKIVLKIHYNIATPTEVYGYIKSEFIDKLLDIIEDLNERVKKLEK